MAAEPNTAADLDGLGPEETVWVVENRLTSSAKKYHTKRDCEKLGQSDSEYIVARQAQEAAVWHDKCRTCTQETPHRPGPDQECPYCGPINDNIPAHLRRGCEDAPQTDADDGESDEAVWERHSLRSADGGDA